MAVEAVRIDERRLSASFRTLSVHEARALLLYGIERRRPVQLVVGRAGSGKSRLLGALSRTAVDGAELVLVRALPPTFEEITVMLASHFGVANALGESPLERLARLAEVLAERRRSGRLVALLIDDVHAVAPTALLDLRLLAGTDTDGGALLPLVIAGRPELAARVAEAAFESLRLAVSTHIELRRRLPATAEDSERAGASAQVVLPGGRWQPRAAAAFAGLLVALAMVVSLRPVQPRLPGSPVVVAQRITDREAHPRDVPQDESVTPAPTDLLVPPPVLPSGRITAASVRSLVEEFSDALARRDLLRLERILARDVRQNGVRGRRAILESYAYRFARLDAPISLDAPTRITLRDGSALVDVPFGSAYRDAGGNAGTVDGTLRIRVVRHGGRSVLDSLDWAFAERAP